MSRELLLGVERVPQPQPCRNPAGDCFACSLIASLGYLFPDREAPTFEDTDRWFRGEYAKPVGQMESALRAAAAGDTSGIAEAVATLDRHRDDPPVSCTWNGMQDAIWRARADGWPVEMHIDMVTPEFDPRRWGYGWPVVWAGDDYVYRLEAWLAAGWVALTVVDLDGRGPIIDGALLNSTDHFLVLDGARIGWQERDGGGASQVVEVHVVDSSGRNITGGYGGTPWLLVRRDER